MLRPVHVILLTLTVLSGCAHGSTSTVTDTFSKNVTQVMVLGTYHFANPGADAYNIEVGSVFTPVRQQEIEAVATALAEWKPNKILVEFVSDEPDLSLMSYRDFKPEQLSSNANEVYQIGYRLAKQLGHRDVYGFDEQPDDDEPDYFPLGTVFEYAKSYGGQEILDGLISYQEKKTKLDEDFQNNRTIAESLIRENTQSLLMENHRKLYYGLLEIGDARTQPGAELNAYWYMRNAKMFAKVDLIADPGDRILILVGSGHQYWLNHFVDVMPDYVGVDAIPYLERAEDY